MYTGSWYVVWRPLTSCLVRWWPRPPPQPSRPVSTQTTFSSVSTRLGLLPPLNSPPSLSVPHTMYTHTCTLYIASVPGLPRYAASVNCARVNCARVGQRVSRPRTAAQLTLAMKRVTGKAWNRGYMYIVYTHVYRRCTCIIQCVYCMI